MEEWELGMESRILKERQEEMLEYMTMVRDNLHRLKQELKFLEGRWQGNAEKVFCKVFLEQWEQAYACANAMGRLAGALIQAERNLLICEKQTADMLG